MSRRPRLWMRSGVVVGAAMCLTSCEGIAFIAKTISGPTKVEAVYTLADRSTLVMVDDPYRRLGDPGLSAVVATNVAFHLEQNEALEAPLISQDELAALSAKLGEDFAQTPIDEVGRAVGAEQVIYVLVEPVSLQMAPGMYRPTATLQVKVMDVIAGERLFPEPPPIYDPAAPSPGHSVKVQMTYRGMGAASRGMDSIMSRMLAETMGLEVARLFYDWKKPDPGSTLQ